MLCKLIGLSANLLALNQRLSVFLNTNFRKATHLLCSVETRLVGVFQRFFFVVVVLFFGGGLVAIVPGDNGFAFELFLSLSGTQTVSVLLVQFFWTMCPFGHLRQGLHFSIFFSGENVCPCKTKLMSVTQCN